MSSDLTAYVRSNRERYEQEFLEFLRIPSVSTEKRYAEDVARCAEWLADIVREAGMDNVEIIPTEGNPFVVADKIVDPDAPTVLVYGHYDVQPVDPEELWDAPPFEPTYVDGRIYARGTNDDKGQVLMHVQALEARIKGGFGMPVNVKLCFEGEEEIGSVNLETFLRSAADRLACDAVIVSDTGMLGIDIPSIGTGLRGIAYLEVFVDGPAGDLHSGSYGGAVVNPAFALAQIIAQLKDEEGRVTIPGFYDRVRPMSETIRTETRALPFTDEEFIEETGAPALGGEVGFTTLERLWYRPALDVNGMISGFTGDGAKTVLPAKVSAKISMRLVPDQTPEDITEKMRKYFEYNTPPTTKLTFTDLHGGYGALVDTNSRAMEAASKAMEGVYGEKPYFVRTGGSIPIVAEFKKLLGLDTVLMGFGLDSDQIHSPNEHFALDRFKDGIRSIIRFMKIYSEV